MADYIKRESALRAIEDSASPFVKGLANDAYWAYKAVEEVPAEDAVEVVRCEDCRWFDFEALQFRGVCRCVLWNRTAEEDGFCSDGERKEDD